MHLSSILGRLLVTGFLASTAAGCVAALPATQVALRTATIVAGVELQEKWDGEAEARRPVYVYEPGDFDPITAPEDLEATKVTPPAATFDMAGARASLHDVDLGQCATGRAAYGHGVVTFSASGHIAKVVIDGPDGLSAETARCIGDRVGATHVAPFSGGDVVTGVTFYVPATTTNTAPIASAE
jgi:hypothetical protein